MSSCYTPPEPLDLSDLFRLPCPMFVLESRGALYDLALRVDEPRGREGRPDDHRENDGQILKAGKEHLRRGGRAEEACRRQPK